jgi:tetratricopeptide (TPR) repeat protein
MASIISKRSHVENLILIYLNETSNEFEKSIDLFQSFVNTIQFFSNPDEFRQFIESIIDEKLFIILSDSFSEQLVPQIESKSQIFSIYIYSHRRERSKKWTNDSSKVKGVYTDLPTISNAFRRDIRQATNDLISIHILPSNPSFICSLLLKKLLLNTQSNDQMKKEFIEYSRFNYDKNPIQLNLIDQYEKTDYHQISAIEWYTRECFISSMINRALRLYDIEILNKIAFFIRDLNKQIQDLHTKSTDTKNFSVFYGQGISNDQLEKFKMNIYGLISFDSFLLTTMDKELSRYFAKQSGNDRKLISILYRIEIDRSKSSTPFVLLDQYDTDQYVLFSLDSFFRIHHLERLEENFWQMNLILIDNNEQQLKDLIKPNRISKGFFSLGQLMFQMNDLNKANNIFQVLLQNTNTINSKELVSIHRMLGRIYQKTEDFPSALFHYQECMKTESTYLSPNDPSLSLTLASIGVILEKLGDLNQALEYYKRAADNQKIDPSILAFYYISIGRIHYKQGENIEARKNFELALKFEQKSSVQNSNFLAEIHHYLTIIS